MADEAIAIAREAARVRGWTWREPVEARRFRRCLVGAPCWEVISNAGHRGANVKVYIEDRTARVYRVLLPSASGAPMPPNKSREADRLGLRGPGILRRGTLSDDTGDPMRRGDRLELPRTRTGQASSPGQSQTG